MLSSLWIFQLICDSWTIESARTQWTNTFEMVFSPWSFQFHRLKLWRGGKYLCTLHFLHIFTIQIRTISTPSTYSRTHSVALFQPKLLREQRCLRIARHVRAARKFRWKFDTKLNVADIAFGGCYERLCKKLFAINRQVKACIFSSVSQIPPRLVALNFSKKSET